jgi:5'-nucleotidase/UDP-sugar diphosphatase
MIRVQVFRFLAITSCLLVMANTAAFAKEYQITILHTNDHHGHFQKFDPYPVKDVGGLAAQSTLVNIVRAEVENAGGHVMVLSAGDVNTGVPESDLLDGEPDFNLMNMIGYDAMTLGNHEFDNSLDVLMKQKGWAKFPFLAANVVMKGAGELLVDPYIIKEIYGLKVAILGLITEDVPTLVLPDNVKGLEFLDVIDTAEKYVPELKKKADLVIALTHIGYYDSDSELVGDAQLAEAVPGIDVIVGGHTHTTLDQPVVVGDTLIVQADGYSEKVGRLNLTVDSDTDKVSNYTYELIPVNGKKRVKYKGKSYYQYVGTGFIEDKDIQKAMAAYLEGADELLKKPVGTADVELVGGKSVSRSQETNLGNLITDGMRVKTGADIALQNGGGIRAGIAPGTITYRDVLTVQPFGNTLTEIMMTGAQIVEVLNVAAVKVGSGGFMQVSGLKVTYNKITGKAESVLVGNAPIEIEKTYKVVTNNFVAAGGDGYKMLRPLAKYDTGYVDAEATMEYIRKHGKVDPKVEGRITVVE